MRKVSISSIKDVDIRDVASLHAICFEEPWRSNVLKSILEAPGAFGLSLKTNKTLVAFLIFRGIIPEGEILSLAVDPDWRREGFALGLLRATFSKAKILGIEEVFLEVAEDNKPARNLYHYIGFIPIGRRKGYYKRSVGSNVDALTLKLRLD